MKYEDESADEVEDVPVSPLLSERKDRYGSVPGLDDEELADPAELERQVMLQEWGPVLALPTRGRDGWIRPSIDEDGNIDFGAFGTVDFERTQPAFDKLRYKADRLREELRNVIIMMETVSDRLPRAKFRVLKLLQKGVIDLEHIQNSDMLAMARYYLRIVRLQNETKELRDASWERKVRLAEVLR
jgi:hypothetical protein